MKKKVGLNIFLVAILALCLSIFVGCNKKKEDKKIQKLPEQKEEKITDKGIEDIKNALAMLDTKNFSAKQVNSKYTSYFNNYDFYKSENKDGDVFIKNIYDKSNNRMYVGTYNNKTENFDWKYTKKEEEINRIKNESEPELIDYKSFFSGLLKIGVKEGSNYKLDKSTNELKYRVTDDLNPGDESNTFATNNTKENAQIHGIIDSIVIKDGEVKVTYHENGYKDKDGKWILDNTEEKTVVLKNEDVKSEIPETATEF